MNALQFLLLTMGCFVVGAAVLGIATTMVSSRISRREEDAAARR